MNLLYLTFGNGTAHHLQAAFSVASFLCADRNVESITVLTDAPQFYTHLQPHLHIETIGEDELTEWKGPHDFFWRIKIKAIERFVAEHTGRPVMYLDTDTFLYNDISLLTTPLAAGRALMHEDEGSLAADRNKTKVNTWKEVAGKQFSGITVNAAHHMWNAGVVASPNTRGGEEFRLAVRLCDDMCATNVRRRLIEQYALSVALHHTYGLQPAAPAIAHYWSNKAEWNAFISEFFLNAYFQSQTTEDVLRAFQGLNLSALPIGKKIKKTPSRLHGWVNKFFKEEGLVYLPRQKG